MLASWIAVGLLLLIGLLLIGLEVFVLPGISLAGALGGIALLSGIITVYVTWGTAAGNLTLICSLILLLGVLWAGYRYTASQQFGLKARLESSVNSSKVPLNIGEEGISVSVLKPVGKVRFGATVFNAFSETGWIAQGVMVEIVSLEGNKIIVRAKTG